MEYCRALIATLHHVFSFTAPPVTQTAVATTILIFFRDIYSKTNFTNYCVPAPLPSLNEVRADRWFLHSLSSASLTALTLQTATLLILGVYVEKRFGSLFYSLLLVLADLIVGFLALAIPVTTCYGSLGLFPSIAALATVLHSDNPRLHPETVPRNLRPSSAVEVRWVVWLLVFLHFVFAAADSAIHQYFLAIAVGEVFFTGRGTLSTNNFRLLVKSGILFLSIFFLPLVFSPFPSGASPPLYELGPAVCADFVSYLAFKVTAVSPALLLCSNKAAGIRQLLLVALAVALIYCAQADTLGFPHLGALGLSVLYF